MPTVPFRAIRALAIILAVSAAATGCATPAGVSPSASPAAEPSPTPSPSPSAVERIAAPLPYVDASCAELLSTASLASGFAVPVAALEVVENIYLSGSDGPLRFALRQLGGIECEWSNGEPIIANFGPNPRYVGVTLRVLPGAEDRWQYFSDYYSVEGAEQAYCGETAEPTSCLINALVADDWVELELQAAASVIGDGSNAEAVTRRLYDEFVAALSAAPASSAEWSPPTGTIPLSSECAQFVSPADAAAIIGLPVYFDGMDGGASLVAASWANSGGSPCFWAHSPEEPAGVFVSWLPGGEWAWMEQQRPGSYEAVAVPGLLPDDAAWLDCPASTGDCALDLIVGHNWIQIALSRDDADKPAVLEQLAAKVVESIRG
ncbi:hypothetical protein ABIB15_001623 [Marisediminicola sp. UYEF4]|uniref:hypothetical protein n=1 Tax=Marisediminicola sp. UYEF4 TaxID=1756384 RepID=UPI00339468DC